MNNRYKFIRARSPFQSLIDYARSPELSVKRETLVYPIQMTLFNGGHEKTSKHSLRVKEGYFFELISQGIWGGKVKDLRKNSEGDPIKTEPDILFEDHSKIKEIKAVSKGGPLKINDEQMAKYYYIFSKGLDGKFPEIRYNIYRHGVKNIETNYFGKSLDLLINDFSSSMKFMVSLPFELIFEIYLNKTDLTSRYEGDKYSTLTRLSSSALNLALAEPKKFLEELGLDSGDFGIIKRKFPSRIKMNGKEINSFPVVFYNLKKDFSPSLENLDEKHFENFYKMISSLSGKKTPEQINAEKDIEKLFGPIPKDRPF